MNATHQPFEITLIDGEIYRIKQTITAFKENNYRVETVWYYFDTFIHQMDTLHTARTAILDLYMRKEEMDFAQFIQEIEALLIMCGFSYPKQSVIATEESAA